MRQRSNMASALTRKARAAIKGRVESVTVKSYDYIGGGEVAGSEIEALMSARQILVEAGLVCSNIKTEFKNLGPRFYIQFPDEVSA